MSQPSFRQKIQYYFENTLSRGSAAVVAWLAILSLIIIFLAALTIAVFQVPAAEGSAESWGFMEALWNNLMRAMDAGNLAGDSGWALRTVSLFVTVGGIFIVATLISAISSGLENSITEIRKGKSLVIEKDHTLILGWSSKIFSILSELIIANENRPYARIVILADKDKVEMEDEIRSKFPSTKSTKIVCRTGSPMELDHLGMIAIHDARSIIIVAPEDTLQPDIFVIKTILAITNNPNRKSGDYHIVAEIQDHRNLEAAKLVGGSEACLLLTSDIIAKVMAQTCRQSGLSVVYTELLDFKGSEIYFTDDHKLAGLTYRDLLHRFDDATVIGLVDAQGNPSLNPAMNRIYGDGEKIILIAEDDDCIYSNSNSTQLFNEAMIVKSAATQNKPEKIIFMGWNSKAAAIIQELDAYVGSGSKLTIASDDNNVAFLVEELRPSLTQLSLEFFEADIVSRKAIEALDPISYEHIIVLCNEAQPIQEADARTLVILLHLRHIADLNGVDMNIVSEMRDLRNRTLAEVAKADDFIVSDNLTSLLVTQISENKKLEAVFQNLLNSEGSEIYIKPIADYMAIGIETDFHMLIEAAAGKGETAIGYRKSSLSKNATFSYGVNCNPRKSDKIKLEEGDKLIVLGEN